MSSIDETQILAEGIGKVLSNKKLVVPAYQRSYSWDKTNVEQFLKDVTSAYTEGSKEYFLGSIVMINTPDGRLEIVDGQQRLATSSILFACIKDYFKLHGEKIRASTIENTFLFSSDIVTMTNEQHLILNTTDNNTYRSLIENSNQKPDAILSKSVKNLFDTTRLAKEHIQAIEKISTDPIDNLAKLVVFMQDNVKVISVIVPDETNAFAIFETLNDRGLALSIADLLKNFLFGQAGTRISEAQGHWNNLVGILNTVGDESLLPAFIRHFWSSNYSFTTEKDLFGRIKNKIHSSTEAIDFLELLLSNANKYAALLNPEHPTWTRAGAATQDTIRVLNDMKFDQTRPLLLAILSNFSDAEVSKSLKKSVNWSVRLLVAGNTRSGQFSKTISDISIAISDKTIRNTKALGVEMRKLVPNDIEFVDGFEKLKPSRPMARYYLAGLEQKLQSTAGLKPGLIPSYSTDEVNLEHILPQTLSSSDWPNFNDETASDNFGRLGNLTLMYSKENSKVGNKDFNEKKKVYTKSAFLHTQELSQYDGWTSESIEARQKSMAQLAKTTWPL